MPENNSQNVFFVDDELIERLMRGDSVMRGDSAEGPAKNPEAPAKKKTQLPQARLPPR